MNSSSYLLIGDSNIPSYGTISENNESSVQLILLLGVVIVAVSLIYLNNEA